jgi:hypothetical protein
MAGSFDPDEIDEQTKKVYSLAWIHGSEMGFTGKEGVQDICTGISSQFVGDNALDMNNDTNVARVS